MFDVKGDSCKIREEKDSGADGEWHPRDNDQLLLLLQRDRGDQIKSQRRSPKQEANGKLGILEGASDSQPELPARTLKLAGKVSGQAWFTKKPASLALPFTIDLPTNLGWPVNMNLQVTHLRWVIWWQANTNNQDFLQGVFLSTLLDHVPVKYPHDLWFNFPLGVFSCAFSDGVPKMTHTCICDICWAFLRCVSPYASSHCVL